MRNISIGPISSDTLNAERLIPCFISEILSIDPDNSVINIQKKIDSMDLSQKEDYWQSEDSDWDMEWLQDELRDLCDVPYVYFGTTEGDGACFGFWVDDDAINQAIKYDEIMVIKDIEDAPEGDNVLYILQSGKYIRTLYRGKEEIWSV